MLRGLKVEATAEAIGRIDSPLVVDVVADRFRPRMKFHEAVLCCVDSISARGAIWRAVRERCDFWVDGRMRGEVIRVLVAADEAGRVAYSRSLFPQAEAQWGHVQREALSTERRLLRG